METYDYFDYHPIHDSFEEDYDNHPNYFDTSTTLPLNCSDWNETQTNCTPFEGEGEIEGFLFGSVLVGLILGLVILATIIGELYSYSYKIWICYLREDS